MTKNVARILDGIEGLGLRHIQRAQDQPVHHTENYGVCADGHGQGQNRGDGESGGLAQLPEREA